MPFFENLRIEIEVPSIAKRRGDDVDAAAVLEARVDERRRFVDAAPDLRHDARRDAHNVGVVAEDDVGELELALALDIDLVRAVHHDVGDAVIGEKLLERPQPQHVVEQHGDEEALLGLVELDFLLDQDLGRSRRRVGGRVRRDEAWRRLRCRSAP